MNRVVGFVVAVIGIAFFLLALALLYKQSVNQESENAKAVLNGIIGKIENLEDGQSNEFAMQGFEGGENWFLVAWGKDDKDKPDRCFFGSCLCVFNDNICGGETRRKLFF